MWVEGPQLGAGSSPVSQQASIHACSTWALPEAPVVSFRRRQTHRGCQMPHRTPASLVLHAPQPGEKEKIRLVLTRTG